MCPLFFIASSRSVSSNVVHPSFTMENISSTPSDIDWCAPFGISSDSSMVTPNILIVSPRYSQRSTRNDVVNVFFTVSDPIFIFLVIFPRTVSPGRSILKRNHVSSGEVSSIFAYPLLFFLSKSFIVRSHTKTFI